MGEDDLKTFIREQTAILHRIIGAWERRKERLERQVDRRLEAHLQEIALQSRKLDAVLARTDEVIAEQQAQRQALLAVLDRLPPPGTAPA